MTEWKKSLDTNNRAVAHRRWVAETERFEAAKALAEKLYGQPTNKSEMLQSAVTSAKQMAVHYGVHPDQAPTLSHNATDDEINAFKQVIRNWNYSVKLSHVNSYVNFRCRYSCLCSRIKYLWHLSKGRAKSCIGFGNCLSKNWRADIFNDYYHHGRNVLLNSQ